MKRLLSIALCLNAIGNISGAVGLLCQGYEVQVGHNGKYFTVTESGRSYRVGKESLDSTLKNINKTNMAMFMKRGRISAHKTSDGSYMLRGHVNGLGGGPVLAGFAYWCTKTLCWGGIAAAGTAVVTSGVGAVVTLAGGSVAAGTAGGAALGAAQLAVDASIAAAGGASTTGVTIVSSALGYTTAGTALAAEGSAALAAGAGSMGVAGFIEALSVAAYAGAMALPTP